MAGALTALAAAVEELAAQDLHGLPDSVRADSTASWLRSRLRMGAAAHSAVRTARALFRGPLPATGQAVTEGAITPAHASGLAVGTHELPTQVTVEAEPVLLEAARRLDHPGCNGSSPTAAGH